MGLPKIIQIPCHHVLANQNDLKFKKGAPLKQVFNIIFGINIIKKLLFCWYFRHISPCFYSNFDRESLLDVESNSTSNEYHWAYFWRTPQPQKQEIPKKTRWWHHHHIFQVFLVFGVVRSIKSILSGYSLDAKFNSVPTSSPDRNLRKNTGRYVENMNKKK